MGADRVLSRRVPAIVVLIASAALVAWVHWPAVSSRAVWLDDEQYVIKNTAVLQPSWEAAWRFVSELRHPSTVEGYYQPLTMLSLMVDSAVGGRADDPRPYHRTNVVLHAANTLLVGVVLLLLFGDLFAAVCVGLLFGLHPMTVEPVTWMAERKTLLATLFTLSAIAAYLTFVRAGAGRSRPEAPRGGRGGVAWSWYGASIACYTLALLSKPTSTPLPVLLLVLDYWPLDRLGRRAVMEKIPFLALGLFAAAITLRSQATAGTITLPSEQSPLRMALVLCHDVVFYLHTIAWPAELTAYYPVPEPMSLRDPAVLAGVVGTGMLVLLLLVSWRWTRSLLAGAMIFFIAILPTMGIVTNVIAADKYVYLPSLGVMVILAALIAHQRAATHHVAERRRRTAVIATVVLLVALLEIRVTRRYLTVWQDSERLYTHVLGRAPAAWALHYNFGDILADQGRMEEAAAQYRASIALHPDDADAHHNLGNALFVLGRPDEAVAQYRAAIRLQPTNAAAAYDLGLALNAIGESDEAVAMFRTVLRLNPDNPRANYELAEALAQRGDTEQAIAYYRKTVALQPDLAAARVGFANALASTGQSRQAIEQYQSAVRLDPNDAATHNNLGVVLAASGDLDEAIVHYREALRLNPALAEARTNLADAVAATRAGRTTP